MKMIQRIFGFIIIVILLNNIKATAPPALPNCEDTFTNTSCTSDTAANTDYYCLKSNVIYQLASKDSVDCKGSIDSGEVNIFEVTQNEEIYTTKIVDGTTDPTSAVNLVIYSCDTNCSRIYGHVKINNKYYTVSQSESKILNGSGYYSIINDASKFYKCTASQTAGEPSSCEESTPIVDGYFMNSDNEVYICDSENSCSLENNIPEDCTSNEYKLISSNRTFKFCKATTALEISSTTQYYLMSSVDKNNLKYPKTLGTGLDTVLLKTEQYSITLGTSDNDGFFIADDDKNLLSTSDEGKLYSCDNGVCNEITLDKTYVGYYKNSDDSTIPYIKCYEESETGSFKCNAIANSDTENCSASTIGQLIKGGKLCLSDSKSVTFLDSGNSPKNYRVNYFEGSIFTSIVTQEGLYGIVKITTNSINIISTALTNKACVSTTTLEITDSAECGTGTEECKSSTSLVGTCYYDCVKATGANCIVGKYYLFDDDDALVTGADADHSVGSLINCKTQSSCEKLDNVVGYFKNSDFNTVSSKPYIKCAEDATTPGTIKCELMASPSSDTTCSSSNIGQLTNDSSVINLCLDGTKKQPFASTNEYEYLLTYHDSSIYKMIIPENKFGIINISQDAMTIDTNFQSDYGICADTDSKVTTLSQSSTTCAGTKKEFCNGGICYNTCKVSATTRDDNCSNDTYYLVKDASSSIPVVDPTQSGKLYFCESGGTGGCTEITDAGYYINDKTDAFICEKGDSFTCKIYSITGTCTSDNIGKPIIDTSSLYFCLNYDNTKETNKDIKTDEMTGALDKNYLLNYKSGNIFGITSGKSGLVSVKAKSVTLVDKTGYCLESKSNSNNLSVAASTEGNPYQCTDGICEAISNDDNSLKEGYYKNIGAISSDPEYIAYTTVSTTVDGVTTTTKKYTAKAATSGTTCSAIGDILVDNNIFSLCLTTSIKIELDPEGSKNGKYFIKVTDRGIVFKQKSDENSHAIIVVENENVYLSEKEENVEIYRYGESTTQKLLNFNNANERTDQCNADKTLKNALLEFSLIDEVTGDTTNYYKLETTTP